MASDEGVFAPKEETSTPKPTQTHVVTPLQSKYSKRVILKTILSDRDDGGVGLVGERLVVGGWVKSSKIQMKDPPPPPPVRSTTPIRDVSCTEILQSRVPLFRSIFKVLGGHSHHPAPKPIQEKLVPVPSAAFLQINDGSCVPCLQVLLDASIAPLALNQISLTGTSILVEGVLKEPSVSGKQVIELKVEKILHMGTVDQANYPLTHTRIPLDNLRIFSHLRPRTTTVASITRIRSALSQATQTFFQKNGFLHVHMPIITSVDSKGFSEKFQVTNLSGKQDEKDVIPAIDDSGPVNLEVVKAAVKEKSSKIEELKRSESNKEALLLARQDLQKANELAAQMETREKSKHDSLVKSRKDSKEFFSHPMYLTVSAQLHLESYACALGSVYSFGPTFEAETSQPKKHLVESWMVELEMAFADIEDLMNCAEDYLKFLSQSVLENCSEDVEFVSKRIDRTIADRLQSVASSSFERITYTEAVDVLKKVTNKTFQAKIDWGVAFTNEHESYLADEVYKRPVIIYNHPKELKPFFSRLNDDRKTVGTIDVIVPKVGTLMRGSQKEERVDWLIARIKELGLPREQYEWYLDLRRHGTVKHSGFGFQFDHMVLLATGLNDIRDVIAFPRCSNGNY